MLKQRALLITVALIEEKLKVNVIPSKAKEGETKRSTPLSYTGSPEELDKEIGRLLASKVDSYLLAEARWLKRKPKWTRRSKQRVRRLPQSVFVV